jgi:1-acyl-sn-glycerol-3-phosphate acyltransferase
MRHLGTCWHRSASRQRISETRIAAWRLSPFKKGPVVLALRTGAPIVPIAFHGARERLPYGALCVRSGSITTRFCRPIETRGLSYADRDALVARLAEVAQRELARGFT